jgi:hypothetical protein
MPKPKIEPFRLYPNERDGQTGHLRVMHKVEDADSLSDNDVVDRHASFHADIRPNGHYPDEHDRLLSRLMGRVKDVRDRTAEGERLKAVKAALDGMDTYALVMQVYDAQDRPLVGTGDLSQELAAAVKEQCPEARASDFTNNWLKPRLDTLVEQGKLVRYQAGGKPALPLAIKGGYRTGSYYYGAQVRIDATLAAINAAEEARLDRERRYAQLGVDLAGMGVTEVWTPDGGYSRPSSYRQVILTLADVEKLVSQAKGA